MDARARFVARTRGYSLFLTPNEAVLASGTDVVRMRFRGANARAKMVPLDRMPGGANYLLGNDPARWRTGVASYRKVRYEQMYPGIDLVFYGTDRELEYDLIVGPGANPRVVRMTLAGLRDLKISPAGDLVGRTDRGEVRLKKPVVYQASTRGAALPIAGRYRLLPDRSVAFDIGEYDRSKPLVIDPVVVYATYLGGNDRDITAGALSGSGGRQMIAVDSTGAAYITGSTDSLDFPTTAGSFQPSRSIHTTTVFVTKIAPDGQSLVYSTYIGGTIHAPDGVLQDFGDGIAVDAAGSAYVVGFAASGDFPASLAPFAPWRGRNMFLLKLDPSGSTLAYSILISAGQSDSATGVAVDAGGNAYVVGRTPNNDGVTFPVTLGSFQPVCRCAPGFISNNFDAFVLKFNPTATALVYGTFIGGWGSDQAGGIAVNNAGEAYVSGRTNSSADFPLQGPAQAAYGGGLYDTFVSKLSADGSSLVFSTYLGGSEAETRDVLAGGIAVDPAGNAYVTGYTDSGDFPTTPGAFQELPPLGAGSGRRAYAAKYSPGGQRLYSTFLSGNGGAIGTSVAADALGRAYLGGGTGSTDFPIVDATQPSLACTPTCGTDAYVTILDASGSTAEFSTYLGGPGYDFATGIALGPHGSIYIAGQSEGTGGFPTTANAAQPTYGGGGSDVFVARIDVGPPPDTTAPVIDVHADITAVATGGDAATVTYAPPPATDDVDGAVPVLCDPPSGSSFPVGTTTVTCTATDASNNSSTSAFLVTVTDAAPTRMRGDGYVNGPASDPGARQRFVFDVIQRAAGDSQGRFRFWNNDRNDRPRITNVFDATSIDSVAFADDPAFAPGHHPTPTTDSVTFTGSGELNDVAGFTFTVTATDRGEPGRNGDTFTLTVFDAGQHVVFTAGGTLASGNNQSLRLPNRER